MKRLLLFFVMLSMTVGSAALDLVIDEVGMGNWCWAAPDEVWFVVMDGNQGDVYGPDYQLIADFDTGNATPNYIYGCGRDFDSDDNIEVMYSIYHSDTYTQSIIVRDIVTGQVDLELPGTASHSWYASTFYNAGERFVQGNRLVSGTANYDRTVVYRSNIVHSVTDVTQPHPSALQAWPNPFVPTRQAGVRLMFAMPVAARASLAVYNVRGQKVRTLREHEMFEAGEHTVWWNGLNDRGQPVASGVYLLRLDSGGHTLVHKSLVLQ
ncbi:MAG: hypothetical protein K8R90_11650 [Candidatus Cloacimonetes bacterium]|nr:hypothetical protein [Candidatus Cloacimonadota bacterium]